MNVLIVEKDENFCNVISSELIKRKKIDFVNVINSKEEMETQGFQLNDSDSKKYEFAIIDLDFVETDCMSFCNRYSISNLIGISSNTKTINKHINNSNVLRIFKKPLNINDLMVFLDKQYHLTYNSNKKYGLINKLSDLGFNISHSGTQFLADSIKCAIDYNVSKTQDIYSIVANKNNIKDSVVKWAIYNCITSAYNGDYDKRLEHFLKIYDGRKPTPKYIIEFFVNIAKNIDV